MIVVRAPYRVSFFGGGTDYPVYFNENGGAVLSTTINKYCYLNVKWLRGFRGDKFRVVWSHIERVNEVEEILHPCVRGALQMLNVDRGIEIIHTGDLPARAGMGSSSAFAVALIGAIHALRDETTTPLMLAKEATHLEQQIIGDIVGCQDQIAAAFGGFNHIEFPGNGRVAEVHSIGSVSHIEALNKRLMLFYTGTTRLAQRIAKRVVYNAPARPATLRRMHVLVGEAKHELLNGSLHKFGALLHETWELKKLLAKGISCPSIDAYYDTGREAGAVGGKLLGAGGRGFLLFYVEPEYQDAVREALPLIEVPFQFENGGFQVVYDSRTA